MSQLAESEEKNVSLLVRNKKVIILGVVMVAVLVGALSGLVAYNQTYRQRVLPGVYLGSVPVGGLTKDEVRQTVENYNNRLTREGINLQVTASNTNTVVNLKEALLINNDFIVSVNALRAAEDAVAIGKSNSLLSLQGFKTTLTHPRLSAPLMVDEVSLATAIKGQLKDFEDPGHDAFIQVASINPLQYKLEGEQTGQVFDENQIVADIKKHLSSLEFETIPAVSEKFVPLITKADLSSIESRIPEIMARGDITLSFVNPTIGSESVFKVAPTDYIAWIKPQKTNGEIIIGFDAEKTKLFLKKNLAPLVETVPQNAKFEVSGGKVKEFQSGNKGQTLDLDKTFAALNDLFTTATSTESFLTPVPVSVIFTEPEVTTASLNDFGISEIVGMGSSSFKGSPTNRIKNLTRAVERLNGALIPPGEEFSTNKYAGPYTPENGFLPELVIKGNKIKAEVGGGMCQIGTTLFRMAMNSGMPITERHNHSLVVGYYADPVNGNPGTDATLYDPLLDFKFKNDTGNYLLLETAIDYKTQILTFTLWGKPDGRSGSFTHPIVKKWLPTGKTQTTFTNTLKPGEQKCQHAYTGAQATFTYTRFTAQGEKIDEVFDSYYRSLPQICLVGKPVETIPPPAQPCVPGQVCTIISSPENTSTGEVSGSNPNVTVGTNE